MKPTFVITPDQHLESALVASDYPNAVTVGTRIAVTRPLLMEPHATVAAGELGTIDHIDERSGLVEILMDKHHHGLWHWLNHIWLMPFGSEDIIDGIIITEGISTSLCVSAAIDSGN